MVSAYTVLSNIIMYITADRQNYDVNNYELSRDYIIIIYNITMFKNIINKILY